MGGHHAHRAGSESAGMKRVALVVIVPIALLTLIALIWMWPPGIDVAEQDSSLDQYAGQITGLQREACEEELPDEVNGCGLAQVEMAEGPDEGREIEAPLPNGSGAPEVSEGDQVTLILSSTPDGDAYAIVDHQRSSGLWVLAAAFVLAIVAFGRWRGVTALAGLAVTFALLLLFIVPAILNGQSPILVAMVGSAAIMLAVLYLTHGFSLSTTVAVLGTLAALVLTAVLAAITVSALHLTGITDDTATSVETAHQVNMQGLLLAGIVIGSLGVLDDVTVTQSATVSEIARANPGYRFRALYQAGSRVGRAHIASVINTIILAYAGSTLPLLILIVASADSLGGVVTDQVIAQEIVRSAVATIGLVAAVPMTTALAAFAARRTVAHLD